jgi:hypothetical protein
VPKFVQIPKGVALVAPTTGAMIANEKDGSQRTVSFREFVVGTLLADPSWTRSLVHVKSGLAIQNAVAAAAEGDVVQLDAQDWTALNAVAWNPSGGYAGWHPMLIYQFVPFFDAIVGASDVDPRQGKGGDVQPQPQPVQPQPQPVQAQSTPPLTP